MRVNLSKGNFSFAREFEKRAEKANKKIINEWGKKAGPIVKKEVVDTIQRGNSPVKGFGRFVAYSPSYTAAIRAGRYKDLGKKLRPINLTLTGKMLRSLKARPNRTGFSLYFSSPLAKYHNVEGAGRSRTIRRILPRTGEAFKLAIIKDSKNLFTKIAKKYYKKLFEGA